MGFALRVVTLWQTPTPATESLTFQCYYLSTKLQITQLIIEIWNEFFTAFIPGDSKLLVVEGVAEQGRTVTNNLGLVVPKIDYDRPWEFHSRPPYAFTGRS